MPSCPTAADPSTAPASSTTELSFTLEEICGLLGLDEAHACAETRELAGHKLQVIEGRLAGLEAMRKALSGLVRQCDAEVLRGDCPILHALVAD